MKYYLKKCWPTVTAASICMVVAYGLQVCTSLVQIQITQGLLDGDLRAFTIRIILLLLTWLAVVLCLIAETFFQGRAVRRPDEQRSAPGYGSGPVAQDPSGVS